MLHKCITVKDALILVSGISSDSMLSALIFHVMSTSSHTCTHNVGPILALEYHHISFAAAFYVKVDTW